MRGPGRLWLLLGLVSGCADPGGEATWSGGVAAVVHEHCAGCHRPGMPAPFPLLTFDDARRRSRQIARVTASGYMPPWLPAHGGFEGARGLGQTEVELLARWAEQGAPRGDAAAEPIPPTFAEGWQLGEPDLVVESPEWLDVPADGEDRFRNLVLPVELDGVRNVAAVEIRPGGRSVHHAVLQVDRTRDARRRAAAEAEAGFGGMAMGLSAPPDGHFLGWTPGKAVRRARPGSGWRLRPGSDLVLQLHVTPTGREERVRPSVGLHFTDDVPREVPFALVMRSERIDIAPGEQDFLAADRIVLPVAAQLRAVYPHAHRLCREMRAWAELPTGERVRVLEIDRWDFDWQDDYRLLEPLALPAGTELGFEYRYDNSAANPDNPWSPPRRVTFGLRSTDEMATLSLTLVAEVPEERGQLVVAMARRDAERAPGDPGAWTNLAVATREAADPAGGPAFGEAMREATAHARRALQLEPGRAQALREVGIAALALGDQAAAEAHLRAALASDDGESIARMYLGDLLARSGRTEEAIGELERAARILPGHAALRNNLATALLIAGRPGDAVGHYRAAVAVQPDHFNAWLNLGRALGELGEVDDARAALDRALALRPGAPDATAVRGALGR